MKTLGDLINLSEETINQFSGIPTQRREKVLQLHTELKGRYPVAPAAAPTEVKDTSPDETTLAEDTEVPEGDLFRYLSAHGVPLSVAARILFIVTNSPNGRVVYNELRKAYGNSKANEYMRYLREYRAANDQYGGEQ